MTEINWWSYLFLLLAGASKGVMDIINFKFRGSIFYNWSNQRFWDMRNSWKNKWKGGDPGNGEAFPFSSTCFVWLTDAWHLIQWLMIKFIFLAVLLHGDFCWWDLLGMGAWYVGFWVTYETDLLRV